MRKKLLNIALILLFAASFVLTSCEKEIITPNNCQSGPCDSMLKSAKGDNNKDEGDDNGGISDTEDDEDYYGGDKPGKKD